MDDLEIPERAMEVACTAYDKALYSDTAECAEKHAVRAATPIIVAAELRRIAIKGEIPEKAYQVDEAIWKRARELDPEVW